MIALALKAGVGQGGLTEEGAVDGLGEGGVRSGLALVLTRPRVVVGVFVERGT